MKKCAVCHKGYDESYDACPHCRVDAETQARSLSQKLITAGGNLQRAGRAIMGAAIALVVLLVLLSCVWSALFGN